MNPGGHPSREALEEILRRIVQIADPQQIILFGSAARGTMGPDSDLDLLVVTRGPAHRRRLASEIYRQIGNVAYPVDVVVATPEDMAEFHDSPAVVISTAIREGETVYDAAA